MVSEQEQVDSILEGLPEEFNSFVMMVYSRFDTPTVEDVEALLLLQEAQFEKFKQELTSPSVSANVAHTETNASDSNSEHESQELGTEHYNVNANRGRGRGKGRGRGRGKGQAQNQGKVKCQICAKPNHDAINCWYRYDPQAMNQNSRGGYQVGPSNRPQNFNPYMRPTAHLAS